MPVKNYQDDLLKRLSNHDYAAEYLKASFDETMKDGNMEAFLLALKNVINATKTVSFMIEETYISKQYLFQLLETNNLPTIETLRIVLREVGLTLDFKPVSEEITLTKYKGEMLYFNRGKYHYISINRIIRLCQLLWKLNLRKF
jgi:DNA-binding phage protein